MPTFILRARRTCSSLLASLVLSVLAPPVHAEEAGRLPRSSLQQPSAPLDCRQRTGVITAEGPTNDPRVVGPRELRWLSLRSEMHSLLDLSRWPAEPALRISVSPDRLASALAELCPPSLTPAELSEIAGQIVSASGQFGVDPMLLGALVYHQSDCDLVHRSSWGIGLTMLNEGLIPTGLHRGELRYVVRAQGDAPQPRHFAFSPPLPTAREALLDPARNLQVAAALLRMYEDQCAELDALCRSVPHRHAVSHFIWGDRVRGTAPEDAVLTARRRLIAYYRGTPAEPSQLAETDAITLGSPLDGPPRIVTSGLGAPREAGLRQHAGIDYLSRVGEPVRAVAAGEVSRAGADLGGGRLLDVTPPRAAIVPERSFGARGLFVELEHEGGYRSVYAHLASYVVEPGQKVARGELIGYVGRTGIRESDAHLHFGLFHRDAVMDPVQTMSPLLFAPTLERHDRAEER